MPKGLAPIVYLANTKIFARKKGMPTARGPSKSIQDWQRISLPASKDTRLNYHGLFACTIVVRYSMGTYGNLCFFPHVTKTHKS